MRYKIYEIMPEVTLIQDDDTNIYLVEGQNSALVIDTGYGFHNLRSKLEEITDKPLVAVFTHGHIDHAFGGHYFDSVYMSRDDVPVYEKHTLLKKRYENSDLSQVKELMNTLGLSEKELINWMEAKPNMINFVGKGDTFDVGGNVLEVIPLKGHTPGSIGLLDRKHRILFSGDGVINHTWMQLPESGTIKEYHETLNSLDSYLGDFDIICAGHRREPASASFIGEMKLTLIDLLNGAEGTPYNNPLPSTSGMIYTRNGCEVVYNPEKIK